MYCTSISTILKPRRFAGLNKKHMSYSYNKRKKNIKKLKKKFGIKWKTEYQKITDEVMTRNSGPLLGTLEDLIGL